MKSVNRFSSFWGVFLSLLSGSDARADAVSLEAVIENSERVLEVRAGSQLVTRSSIHVPAGTSRVEFEAPTGSLSDAHCQLSLPQSAGYSREIPAQRFQIQSIFATGRVRGQHSLQMNLITTDASRTELQLRCVTLAPSAESIPIWHLRQALGWDTYLLGETMSSSPAPAVTDRGSPSEDRESVRIIGAADPTVGAPGSGRAE